MKNSWCKIGLILVFSLIFSSVISINSIETSAQLDDVFSDVDWYVENELMKKNLLGPGTSLGIINNNETVYLKGYGKADANRIMTAETPLFLGSVSKSFTALAIMQLYEEGKLSLDTPVQQYIPWFTTKNETAAQEITIRHLLHHVSGFHKERRADANHTLEELVRQCKDDRLLAPPAQRYFYSNVNYQVLGYLIEVITNQTYNAYIQGHIFDPLNMSRSYLSEAEAKANGLAQGYILCYGIPIPENPLHPISWNPSSNIISTAEDMTHYMIAIMNKGKYGKNSILSAGGIKILQAQSESFANATDYPGYAMGWFNMTVDGVKMIRHTGRARNYAAEVVMAPEEGWGVVILHNVYTEFCKMYGCDLGGLNIMNLLLGKPIELKHKLSFKGFYVIVGLILLSIPLLVEVPPMVFANRRFNKLFAKVSDRKTRIKRGIIRIMPDFVLGFLLVFVVPGLLAIILGEHWVWFWGSEALTAPDLMIFLILWTILTFALGTYKIILLTKKLKKRKNNSEGEIHEEGDELIKEV